ncbi:hypothetical protein NPIL_453101, partial [Nephila pilipes]
MHSIQEELGGNHFSDTPLPDNYSNNGLCSTTTISNISDRSKETLDGCMLNDFSENAVDAEYTPMNVCIDGKTMSYDVAHGMLQPEIQSTEEIESHEPDQTKASENCGKIVARNPDSINSKLKCQICGKHFSYQ